MSWAKIDDQIAFHAKTLAAGNEAFGAWVRMLAHCCAHLTDGVVAEAVARSIASPKTIRRLVDVHFLDEIEGGGYRIHDFADWNPSGDEARAKRGHVSALRAEAGRKGAASRWQRSGKQDGNEPSPSMANASTLPSGTDGKPMAPSPSPSPSDPDPPGSPPLSNPKNATADGCFGDGVSAWCEGIRTVTGAPFFAPRGGTTELAKLVTCLVQTLPDPATRVEGARRLGAEYARARAGETLNAHKFQDWLGSGRPERARPAGAVPDTPPAPYHVGGRRRRPESDLAAQLAERARIAGSSSDAPVSPDPPKPEPMTDEDFVAERQRQIAALQRSGT